MSSTIQVDQRTPRIDIVLNLLTPEIVQSRPSWSNLFHTRKIGADETRVAGMSIDAHVEMMDEAGIDLALLIAPKMGRRGLPSSWELAPSLVMKAVERHPTRFRALAGINPHDGMAGLRELERLVTQDGFIGAHLYPQWFELPPDHRKYYPFYTKCAELGIPIQMQVGHCLRYDNENPLPSSNGRPLSLDAVACDFPELKLIGIHLGWPWMEEMISVAYKHPNVYIGSDAYAPKHWPASFVHFINTFGHEKAMFGTDWPVVEPLRAVSEVGDLQLRPSSYESFMGGNAARVYGLESLA